MSALLFGLNYASKPELALNGCWNDAIGMYSLLSSSPYGFKQTTIDLVIDYWDPTRCTKAGIYKALYNLALKSWKESLDKVVITYSGHGSRAVDKNGDEKDGYDEAICPLDVMSNGLIIDDELFDIFKKFNPKTRIFAVFDSCNSGSVLDLPYQYTGSDANNTNQLVEDVNEPTIVMISGCKDDQVSYDAYNAQTMRFGGALTTSLIQTLSENSDIGVLDMHAKILKILKDNNYNQFPILSSNKKITNETKMFK